MRGRNNGGNNNNNNNNRKGPNPLTRNYESNGPDVKIRGSAQQIAEKYAQLARDAQGAGDRVMAENYLQHAEHYNRIIAAAQAQMPIQSVQQNRDLSDDDMDDERDEFDAPHGGHQQPQHGGANGHGEHQREAQQQPAVNLETAPQPVIEGTPAEVALNPEASGEDNGGRREREAGGEQGGPRRGRRPRRNNNRGERGEDGAPEAAAPVAAEQGGGEPVLADN